MIIYFRFFSVNFRLVSFTYYLKVTWATHNKSLMLYCSILSEYDTFPLQCAEPKREKCLKAPSAFLTRFSANSFLRLKIHILLNVFSFLNFFDWLTHIQSSSNFVQRKKLISRGHNIKLKKKIWEFNFEKKFFSTKLTLLIPKIANFLV